MRMLCASWNGKRKTDEIAVNISEHISCTSIFTSLKTVVNAVALKLHFWKCPSVVTSADATWATKTTRNKKSLRKDERLLYDNNGTGQMYGTGRGLLSRQEAWSIFWYDARKHSDQISSYEVRRQCLSWYCVTSNFRTLSKIRKGYFIYSSRLYSSLQHRNCNFPLYISNSIVKTTFQKRKCTVHKKRDFSSRNCSTPGPK